MAKPILFCFILISCMVSMPISSAQTVICSEVDRAELENRLETIRDLGHQDPGTAIVAIGTMFLGTPYVAHTLERDDEQLVINFQGLDCTTFVENVLALYRVHSNKAYTFDAFAQQLQQIRYRNGQIHGYSSRLHYFTEWIANNEKKGMIRDVTAELGGKEKTKERKFMSQHREAYSALTDAAAYQGILDMEEELANTSYAVLAQDDIIKAEPALHNGDIVAFATSIDGLDVTHTGLLIWQGDRVHLLHASSSGQVEISRQPLADYARGISKNTGVIIARVVE